MKLLRLIFLLLLYLFNILLTVIFEIKLLKCDESCVAMVDIFIIIIFTLIVFLNNTVFFALIWDHLDLYKMDNK